MARRRRRSSRKRGPASYGFDAAPVGLVVLLLALLVRLLLTAEGFALEANVRFAESVEATTYEWPVTDRSTAPDVASRSGLVLVGRLLNRVAREWTAASSAEPVLITAGAIFGAALPATIVWLGMLMGLGRRRAALAGVALAFSPLHVAASTTGDLTSLAMVVAGLAIGASVIAARERSVPLAAVAGLATTVALAGCASAVVALVTCVAGLASAREKRKWLLMAYGVTAATGVAIAVPGAFALAHFAIDAGRNAGPIEAMRTVVGAVTPIGLLVLIAGAAIAVVSGRRVLAVIWFAAALVLHVPSDPGLASLWAAPAAILFGSAALDRWQRVLVPVVALVVVVAFVLGFRTLAYRHDRVGPKRVAERVADLTRADAVVVSGEPAYIGYYAEREVRGWPPREARLSRAVSEHAEQLTAELLRVVRGGRPVHALRSTFVAPGGDVLESALREHFNLTAMERLETETIDRRLLRLARMDDTIYALTAR